MHQESERRDWRGSAGFSNAQGMNNDMNSAAFWLNINRLPARLTDEQAAPLLGFKPHDMYRLRKAGLLKCLGGGSNNSVKYYATVEILKLASDPEWLDLASRAVSRRERRS